MDKYEYKVRADEIKNLIAMGEYSQAADIADTIDWRRVKSVMMLCTISDLYKINRRYEDAKNMMLLAYERRPGGRSICYSLCELCIKTEEFVQAINYYKEFVQVAPKDPGRYILQYKLYEAQDVSLEERISVLEELKKRDYREKWAYELAYLYHRVGLATRCVEECDEMILWFGDGKYVIKAMELKMLHQPLTPEQQARYDRRFEPAPSEENHAPQDIREQTYEEGPGDTAEPGPADNEAGALQGDTIVYEGLRHTNPEQSGSDAEKAKGPDAPPEEELDIHVKTMDMGQYNTINLQAELAAGLREVLGDDQSRSEAITRSIVAPMLDTETLDYPELEDEDIDENDVDNGVETIESSEVFFGETGEIGNMRPDEGAVLPEEDLIVPEAEDILPEEIVPEADTSAPDTEEVLPQETSGDVEEILTGTVPEYDGEALEEQAVDAGTVGEPVDEKQDPVLDVTADTVMNQLRMENIVKAEEQARIAQPPKELASVLSQESDGQISLVMPERETVEKQITGQLSIQDILNEWERMKKEGEERRKEEVRQRVLQQTGSMFTEFEASVRDGLLEQLEKDTSDTEPVQEESEETALDAETAQEELAETVLDLEAAPEEPEETSLDAEAVPEEPEETAFDLEAAPEEPEDTAFDPEAAQEEPEETALDMEAVPEEPEETALDAEAVPEESEETAFDSEAAQEEPGETSLDAEAVPEESEETAFDSEAAPEETAFDLEAVQEEPTETVDDSESAQEQAAPDADWEAEESAEEIYEEDEIDFFAKGMTEEIPESEDMSEAAEGDKEREDDFGEVEELEEIQEESAADETPDREEAGEAFFEGSVSTGDESAAFAPRQQAEGAPSVERDKAKVRQLTREEKELFGPYIQSRTAREQLVRVLDNISLAAYTGNVIIAGEEGMDTNTLAMNMVREIQNTDSNFSGKVARITGRSLNNRDVASTLQQLQNGALLIQEASEMSRETVVALHKGLQGESLGIIVIMEDTKRAVRKLLAENKELETSFTARFEIQALSNDLLVEYAKQYAKDKEYSIDDLGILALHTRIDEMQTIDHAVTVSDVREIVDEAIRHAGKKNLKHFVDILLAKRYDEEDMIILTEKDFA